MKTILFAFTLLIFASQAFANYCVKSSFSRLNDKQETITSNGNLSIREYNDIWKQSYSQHNFSYKTSTEDIVGNSLSSLSQDRRDQVFATYLATLKSTKEQIIQLKIKTMTVRAEAQILKMAWKEVSDSCVELNSMQNYDSAMTHVRESAENYELLDKVIKACTAIENEYKKEIDFFLRVKQRFQGTTNCP